MSLGTFGHTVTLIVLTRDRQHVQGTVLIEEVCNVLTEEVTIQLKDGQTVLTCSIDHLIFPDTRQAVIRARLYRLDRYARQSLRLASVIGRELAQQILEWIPAFRDRLSPFSKTLKALESYGQ